MMCKINQTSQDFLFIDSSNILIPEEVITIERNSICIQPSSSQAIQFCPSLTPDSTTNSNHNVTKAGIIQKMLSIQSHFSIDKIKHDVMRVTVSLQECVKIDQASNELRSSPSIFISKIDKITQCDYLLDNHKMCIDNIKTLFSSSKYDQQRPDGLTMIGNMVKDVVSRNSPDTSSKDTSAYTDCELLDEEPSERLLTHCIASAASFTTPSTVPSSENQTVQQDQRLYFQTNDCRSSKSPVPVSPTRRGCNTYLRKTIAKSIKEETRSQRY
jgi:hypothetical protein